jgi:hypothetical protein
MVARRELVGFVLLFSASAAAAAPGSIASAIIAACPLAEPGDEVARQRCATALAGSAVLDEVMAEPFLWGAQSAAGKFDLADSHLTRFNPLVWRRLYLSLFMFGGESRVERLGATTVIHLPARFRNELDNGSYPYPFWHTARKWAHYQVSTEVLLVVVDGKIKGAMRGAVNDESRPHPSRPWDGKWTWKGKKEPHATLYRSLFSPGNPHVVRVEAAYRRLESAMRPHGCGSCHSPNNAMGMNPLEILVYPNQALNARHTIAEQIQNQTMPPETADQVAGIRDERERRRVLKIARQFEEAAEAALAFERKKVRSPAVAASDR